MRVQNVRLWVVVLIISGRMFGEGEVATYKSYFEQGFIVPRLEREQEVGS